MSYNNSVLFVGTANYVRCNKMKMKMGFSSDVYFIRWLLDLADSAAMVMEAHSNRLKEEEEEDATFSANEKHDLENGHDQRSMSANSANTQQSSMHAFSDNGADETFDSSNEFEMNNVDYCNEPNPEEDSIEFADNSHVSAGKHTEERQRRSPNNLSPLSQTSAAENSSQQADKDNNHQPSTCSSTPNESVTQKENPQLSASVAQIKVEEDTETTTEATTARNNLLQSPPTTNTSLTLVSLEQVVSRLKEPAQNNHARLRQMPSLIHHQPISQPMPPHPTIMRPRLRQPTYPMHHFAGMEPLLRTPVMPDTRNPGEVSNGSFVCNVCGKYFPHVQRLRMHMKVHADEKPFTCPICSKKFSDKGNMRRHVYLHSGIKPYSCNICGAKFTLKHNMKTHVQSVHGLNLNV